MISYEDFELRIQPDGESFVVSRPEGSQTASEPFEFDLSGSWIFCNSQSTAPEARGIF